MAKKSLNKLTCFLCGKLSENGPEIASVSFHENEDLRTNEKGNGYVGSFLKGAAHVKCLEPYLSKAENNHPACAICVRPIFPHSNDAFKLAIYIFKKKGCSAVLGVHEECFKGIKIEAFSFVRPL